MAAMGVPMGGWKQSGIGFRHGEYGIKKYCRAESIVVTRFGGKREPNWYPYTKGRRGLVDRVSRAVSARTGSGGWGWVARDGGACERREVGTPPREFVAPAEAGCSATCCSPMAEQMTDCISRPFGHIHGGGVPTSLQRTRSVDGPGFGISRESSGERSPSL